MMYAKKIIYNGREQYLPIICSAIDSSAEESTVTFVGNTARFSNVKVEGTSLIVNGVRVADNTLILEE